MASVPRLSPRRRSPDRIRPGLGNDRLAQTPTFFLLRCTRTSPPHEMSYSLIETLQYGGSRAQESAPAASTCSGPLCSTHPHLSALLCGALTPEAAAAASVTVLTGDGAAIKYRTVPPGEAAHFVFVRRRGP